MSNFTAQEAGACTIVKCESFKLDGAHQHWHIIVVDDNNHQYEFINDTIPGSANATAVKSSIKTLLMDTEKLPAPPQKSFDTFDEVEGDTVD